MTPLWYVAREEGAPLDGAEGEMSGPLAQLIDHALHWIPTAGGVGTTCHPNFVIDNKTFLDEFAEACHDHSFWTYIKPFLHSRNGCGAYLVLVNHFVGPKNIDNLAVQVEQKLNNITYPGRFIVGTLKSM